MGTYWYRYEICCGDSVRLALQYHTEKLRIRVESGSDDPDNVGHLGHFFDGSSGSHPQTELSGCDPDFLVH